MRLPRLAAALAVTAAAGLTACGSSHPSGHPSTTAATTGPTTSSPRTTTASSSTTSAPATTAPVTTAPVSTAPVTGPAGPRFVSLGGPPQPVPCNAPTSVQVEWETRNAASVTLRINGGALFATYPGGRQNQMLPLACDGTPQRYTFTAHAADGHTAVKTLTITERAR